MSIATVDRVLNQRPGVSEKARDKVRAAIHALSFRMLSEDLLQAPRPELRNLFLLPKLDTSFARQMVAAVQAAETAVDDVAVTNDIRRINLRDGKSLIAELDAVDPKYYDGVALFALDVPGVRQAIDRVVAKGVKVVPIVTDIPTSKRHFFVGTDNTSAGRVAGTLMGRFAGERRGTIAVLVGSLQMRDHLDRYFGFEQIIRAEFPDLRILPVEEGDSLRERNLAITERLLAEHDDLVGLYSAAAGNSGILDALEQRAESAGLVVILHELSDRVRAGLTSGVVDAVIAQDTGHIARSAVRVLRALCRDAAIHDDQERIRIEIYLADNLP